MSTQWSKGFEPEPDTPASLQQTLADQRFAEQVRDAALAWALKLDAPELRAWAEPFADWCAERSWGGWWFAYDTQYNAWWHRLGNFKTRSLKRWWTTFYGKQGKTA
jgi:hypothetical protein